MPTHATKVPPPDADYNFTCDEIREQLTSLGVIDLTEEQLWKLKRHLDNVIAKELKTCSLEYNIANLSLHPDEASSDNSLTGSQITSSTPNAELGQTGDRPAQRWKKPEPILPSLLAVPQASNCNESLRVEPPRISSSRSRSKTDHHSGASRLAHIMQSDVREENSNTTSSVSDIEDIQLPIHLKRHENSARESKHRRSTQLEIRGSGERVESDENTSKTSSKVRSGDAQLKPSRSVLASRPSARSSSQSTAVDTRASAGVLVTPHQRAPSKTIRNPLLIHRPITAPRPDRIRHPKKAQIARSSSTNGSRPTSVQDVSQGSDRSFHPFERSRPNSANDQSSSPYMIVQRLLEHSQISSARRSSSVISQHRPPSSSGDPSPRSIFFGRKARQSSGVTSTGSSGRESSPIAHPRPLRQTNPRANYEDFIASSRTSSFSARSLQPRSVPASRLTRFADNPVEKVHTVNSREHSVREESEKKQMLPFRTWTGRSSQSLQTRRQLDPVSRYHSYRRSWLTHRAPGEDARRILRWNIKTAMMHREVPLLQRNFAEVAELFGGTAVNYLRREQQKKLKALNLSYIPPTSRRHDSERWRVRSALSNPGGSRFG